jgi:hypothetical protein
MESFPCQEELAGLLSGYEVHPALAARRCGVAPVLAEPRGPSRD